MTRSAKPRATRRAPRRPETESEKRLPIFAAASARRQGILRSLLYEQPEGVHLDVLGGYHAVVSVQAGVQVFVDPRIAPATGQPPALDVAVVCLHDGAPPRRLGRVVRVAAADAVWCGTDESSDVVNSMLIVKGRVVTLVATTVTQFELQPGERVVGFSVTQSDRPADVHARLETDHGVYRIPFNEWIQRPGAPTTLRGKRVLM